MKRFLFLLSLSLFLACSDDDGSNGPNDETLNGEWVLTNVSCFCAFGPDYDFTQSQVNFDTAANRITITNTGEFQFIRDSGTYNYMGNGNVITLDDDRSYEFAIDGNTLLLVFVDEPNIADDEVSYTFMRP